MAAFRLELLNGFVDFAFDICGMFVTLINGEFLIVLTYLLAKVTASGVDNEIYVAFGVLIELDKVVAAT